MPFKNNIVPFIRDEKVTESAASPHLLIIKCPLNNPINIERVLGKQIEVALHLSRVNWQFILIIR